jgi:hypothetical protein
MALSVGLYISSALLLPVPSTYSDINKSLQSCAKVAIDAIVNNKVNKFLIIILVLVNIKFPVQK